jgi:hypothetical protein
MCLTIGEGGKSGSTATTAVLFDSHLLIGIYLSIYLSITNYIIYVSMHLCVYASIAS